MSNAGKLVTVGTLNFSIILITVLIASDIFTPFPKRKTGLFDYSIESVQKQYEILSFDASAANIYSDLYERLKAKGAPAQRFDLMIASIAISNNLILVTRNVSDFKDIAENSNLMIENWFEE